MTPPPATPSRSPSPIEVLRLGRYELFPAERQLRVGGRPVALGGRAFDILLVLALHRERPVSKAELIEAVWPEQDVEEGNLPVHISALRKALGPQAITTVPGCGYRFGLTPPPSTPAAPTATPAAAPALADAPAVAWAAPVEPPPRTNLPQHLPALIGRDSELAALGAELAQAPLLSIVGPGGIGKTQLARWLASAQLGELGEQAFPDGVWWVDLADLSDGADLIVRIGLALGVPLHRAPRPMDALVKGLQRQRLLVVLDNCEHRVDEVAALVDELLRQAPGLRWLVTTQEPLKLPLERVFRLDTLAVPPPGTGLAAALAHGAVALLAERARASDRRFALTEDNIALAIEVCAQLDGIALAIEMAAARLPWLGLEGVRSRLGERLRLLAADARNAPLRHRTLHAALDWSHGLLTPTEQTVFRRLSVFRGGFTLELAQAVVADGHVVQPWDALDALGALVDKSLVQAQAGEAGLAMRYRLLESARLYAQHQISAAGEEATIARRHARALADWAGQAEREIWHQTDRAWLPSRELEIDNLRVALATAVQMGEVALVAPIYDTMSWLNNLLGGGTEVRSWVAAIEPLLAGAPPGMAGRLLVMMGSTFRNNAPPRAAAYIAQGRDRFREAGDRVGLFRALAALGIALARQRQVAEARAALAEAQSLLQPDWPARLRMFEAETAGMVAIFEDQIAQARQHYQRYRVLVSEAGAEGGLTTVMLNLADIALTLGEAEEAARIGREHVAWLRTRRNAYSLGWALGNLCAALTWLGDFAEAEATGREALPHMRFEEYAAWLFDHFALLAALRQRPAVAAALAGHADAARQRTQSVREPAELQARQRAQSLAQAALGEPEWARLSQLGAALSDAQADALAFAETTEPVLQARKANGHA